MTVLSCLRLPVVAGVRSALTASGKNASGSLCQVVRPSGAVRCMSEGGKRVMQIKPSRFEWERWKDDLHFFLTLGIVPIMTVVAYYYLRVGPAELSEIPEGYVPRHWEYVQNPIARMFQRTFYDSFQKSYEKMCHVKDITEAKKQKRLLERKVRELEKTRQDFKGWYFAPIMTESTDKGKEYAREQFGMEGRQE